jgi:SAM-dependent methyltransferase
MIKKMSQECFKYRPDDMLGPYERQWIDHSLEPVESCYAAVFGEDTPLARASELAVTPEGLDVLDAGCGSGRWLNGLANAVRIRLGDGARVRAVGLNDRDFSQESIDPRVRAAVAAGNIAYDLGHVQNMPYADNEFNLVHCFEVLHRPKTYQPAVREFMRVTRPGGTIFFNVESGGSDLPGGQLGALINLLPSRGYAVRKQLYAETDDYGVNWRAMYRIDMPTQ